MVFALLKFFNLLVFGLPELSQLTLDLLYLPCRAFFMVVDLFFELSVFFDVAIEHVSNPSVLRGVKVHLVLHLFQPGFHRDNLFGLVVELLPE